MFQTYSLTAFIKAVVITGSDSAIGEQHAGFNQATEGKVAAISLLDTTRIDAFTVVPLVTLGVLVLVESREFGNDVRAVSESILGGDNE